MCIRDSLQADPLEPPRGILEHVDQIFGMARNFHLSADLARLVDDAHRRLFDRDVQSGIMFHAALLHLMLVAASTQTTSIISQKRSASTKSWDRRGWPNTPSNDILDRPHLVEDRAARNQQRTPGATCRRLHMNRLEPAGSHDLGDGARV